MLTEGKVLTDYECTDAREKKQCRKIAKKLIKVAKKHPSWYTQEDVQYAKLIKRVNKKKPE
tara:strand:- start:286 stop:468 length:183 start_codon:yes stop_codon:yes gene_type:complete